MHGFSICPSLLNNTLRHFNSSTRSHSPPERTIHPFPSRDRGLRIKIRLCSLNLVALSLGPDCPHMLHLLPILPLLPSVIIPASQSPGALASCISPVSRLWIFVFGHLNLDPQVLFCFLASTCHSGLDSDHTNCLLN